MKWKYMKRTLYSGLVISAAIWQKKSRLTGRVKEGRKGLPLPATGDEKGAFEPDIATPMPTWNINSNTLIYKGKFMDTGGHHHKRDGAICAHLSETYGL